MAKITIVVPPGSDEPIINNFPTVTLTRDDQTVLWELGDGVEWGEGDPPIVFLNPQAGDTYQFWPGTNPRPVEPADARSSYWASANSPMPNGVTNSYHYKISVMAPDSTGFLRRFVLRSSGPYVDPDITNEPRP